jgi:hypothetical protein
VTNKSYVYTVRDGAGTKDLYTSFITACLHIKLLILSMNGYDYERCTPGVHLPPSLVRAGREQCDASQ